MTKQQVRNKIVEIGIVPVVRAASAQQAMQAAAAVCAGGIPIVEITMTVPGAIEVITQLAKSMGNDLLIDAEAAARCIDAGAEFLVSPGFDLATVQFAKQQGKLIMAGALTPTEVITAWKAGSDFVKIFPCGTVGGAKYIKALKAPLPQVPMVPTGGVNLDTAADFIRAGADALGIGGELVSAAACKSGNLSIVTDAARLYVDIVQEARRQTI
jgi:2-dehydro-3-deoxyphosphogluconate aldolase/(4S)-4-hydroxy-2-oxoglutarate aldolase